jgi:hypothetical protein
VTCQERDPQGLRRGVRNGQVPAWRITCGMGRLKVQGPRPRANDRRVDEHGSGAGWRAGSCRRTCVPCRKSRRCCWCAICVLSTGDLRPAVEALLGEDAVGLSATNIGQPTTVCGMLGGVAAVSQAQPGWMTVRVHVGEGGAIRCRSQTDLDTPSVEYPVQPRLRTRPNCHDYPSANTGAQSRHDIYRDMTYNP